MKVCDYIARYLHARGVSHVYEMSGGMITFLLDSMHREGKIKVVSVHHEQAAAFAADAAGRMTGIPGVAMATSGPGATNLLTGIGSCHFDSSPAVFITGQVNRHEQKKDRAVRQLGFQETDIVAMAGPITKAAWLVEDPAQIPQLLADAFKLAVTGRPGPVLIDVPMDVQRADIGAPALPPPASAPPILLEASNPYIDQALAALTSARRPLILAGGGIRSALAAESFRTLVDRLRVPVVNSLMAVDVLPCSSPLRIGMIGSYGNRWANHALGSCDVLLVLGSRLDVRQTGADTESFSRGRQIYHVDVDEPEMNNRVKGCLTLVADLRGFLHTANTLAANCSFPQHTAWLAESAALRHQWPDTAELNDVPGINPNAFMHALSAASHAAGAFVVDVGQHQMWAAQSLELQVDQRFLTSGGMGSMGFALPAAIGAAFACGKPVVVIAGDGGFQSNIQELQTIVRNQLPAKIIVINNLCHGMVRQFQQSYFDARYQSTLWGYSAPDFARIASAYDIEARTVAETTNVADALTWLWREPNKPALLQVMVDTYANAYPKMAFGRPITEMEPLVKPVEMEGT